MRFPPSCWFVERSRNIGPRRARNRGSITERALPRQTSRIQATLLRCSSDAGSGDLGRPIATARADHGAYLEQLREEGQFQRLAQEGDAAGAAGAGLETDDPLHRAHVPEAPQLELGLEVDQVLAQGVL